MCVFGALPSPSRTCVHTSPLLVAAQASFEEKGLRKRVTSRLKRDNEAAAAEMECLNYEG